VIYCHVIRVLHFASRLFAPENEVGQHHDNGNRQQEMDEPAHRVTAYETEEPQKEQYYRNCVQHIIFLFFWLCLLQAHYDLG
jgi:hypothetical protein